MADVDQLIAALLHKHFEVIQFCREMPDSTRLIGCVVNGWSLALWDFRPAHLGNQERSGEETLC
jgi:hypothetical protein